MDSSLKNIPVGWNVKLSSEVLFFQEGPGVRKWQFKKEGVKLLNGGNINNNTINLSSTKNYLSEDEVYSKYKHFLIDEGDLLIACSGITVNTFYKKIAFVRSKDLPLCLNTSTMRFKSLADIELRYFYYYLQTNYFTKQIQRLITGSAQLNFGPSHMRKIEVLLPPLDQQKKIAAILDAADGYRQKTKALIEKHDTLTQSLFIDMFGDPVRNPKGWEVNFLEQVTTKIGSGATPRGGKQAYKKEGISLIRSMNVYDYRFKYKNLAFIDQNQAAKLKNVIVEKGDVLFNITGASICRSSVVPNNVLPARVNQHVSILRPITSIITSKFLSRFLISENVKTKLLGVGSGGGAVMEAITKGQLQKIEVIPYLL